jgi:hypothetical protein
MKADSQVLPPVPKTSLYSAKGPAGVGVVEGEGEGVGLGIGVLVGGTAVSVGTGVAVGSVVAVGAMLATAVAGCGVAVGAIAVLQAVSPPHKRRQRINQKERVRLFFMFTLHREDDFLRGSLIRRSVRRYFYCQETRFALCL